MTPFEITKVAIACVAFLLFGVLSTVFAVVSNRAQGKSAQKVATHRTLATSSFFLMCITGVVIVTLI